MLIYLMLLIFIIITIIMYFKFNKDILQPAVIFSAMYTFSILCATVNKKNWGINLSLNTFLIIVLGGLEFVVISLLINKYYTKKQTRENVEVKIEANDDKQKEREKVIHIEKWKVALIIAYSIITIIVLALNVLSIASKFGYYFNFSEALSIFRANTSYESNASLSHIISIMIKPLSASAYVCLYIYIKNIIYKNGDIIKKVFKEAIYLLPALLYIILNLLKSNRINIIWLAMAGFVMFVILWYTKHNWLKKIKLKTIMILIVIVCIGLVIFYFSGKLIGRTISKNIFEYITMYAGGSIQCLDLYIKEPVEKTGIIGYETFFYFIRNLCEYGPLKLDTLPTAHLEWRYSNGIMVGNVYTAYRRWIQDFSYIGMIILQAGMAIFYNVYYNKIKYNKRKSQSMNDLAIIMYGYFAYSLFTHSIDSTFYSHTFRLAFITQLLTIIIVYIFLMKLKINLDDGLNVSVGETEIIKNWKIQTENLKIKCKGLKK